MKKLKQDKTRGDAGITDAEQSLPAAAAERTSHSLTAYKQTCRLLETERCPVNNKDPGSDNVFTVLGYKYVDRQTILYTW